MTSIRDNLCNALVARIAAIDTTWDAQLRSTANQTQDGKQVLAIVAMVNEAKQLAGSDAYSATLNVEVLIVGNAEDADATLDAGNPFRYLDRLVADVERVVHAPDAWGVDPDYTDVQVTGHTVLDPSEDNTVAAVLAITFTYRHHYQDPDT